MKEIQVLFLGKMGGVVGWGGWLVRWLVGWGFFGGVWELGWLEFSFFQTPCGFKGCKKGDGCLLGTSTRQHQS